MRKIVIGISGSSGSIYARLLLESFQRIDSDKLTVGLIVSENARKNWALENRGKIEDFGFEIYGQRDFNAPFASGSAQYDCMIVCPCSMGTLGRISSGVSNDLLTRSADVILKERRKLILVPRETPFSLIHIRNMETITLAGGIIVPAIPSFYSDPKSIDELALTVVDRVLDLAGFNPKSFRWGS